jgi:hypothetical protein
MRPTSLCLPLLLAACHGADTAETYTHLELYPADVVLSPGAEITLRAVAIDSNGDTVDVPARFRSSDTDVVTTDPDGDSVAVHAGNALLHAEFQGLVADGTVTVKTGGALEFTVVDGATGEPIPRAVVIDDDETRTADSQGHTHIRVVDGDVATFTVEATGYVPATFYSVAAREIVVPLRRETVDEGAELVGLANLDDVKSSDVGQKVVGLASTALEDPMLFDIGDLFAANRPITIAGYDVDAPRNLYVEQDAPTWELDVPPGPTGVWTLAGPLPVLSFATSFDTTQSALQAFLDHLDDFSYAWVPSVEAVEGTDGTRVDLAPFERFDAEVDVQIPGLPQTSSDDDTAMVMILAHQDDVAGEAVIGMAAGLDDLTVPRVPNEHFAWDGAYRALAISQQGGLGGGGPRMMSIAEVRGDVAVMPEWQSPPRATSFSAAKHDFSLTTDERATFALVTIRSPHGEERDLYVPGGRFEGRLPADDGVSMGYGQTSWTVTAFETTVQTWDGLLSSGEIAPPIAEGTSRTVSVATTEFNAAPNP